MTAMSYHARREKQARRTGFPPPRAVVLRPARRRISKRSSNGDRLDLRPSLVLRRRPTVLGKFAGVVQTKGQPARLLLELHILPRLDLALDDPSDLAVHLLDVGNQ